MIVGSREMPCRTTVVLLAMLAVAGLTAAQDVTHHSRAGTDFGKYKTYKWVRVDGATYPDESVDKQIKAAIDSQLAAKGLVEQPADASADLDVAYQVAIGQEQLWRTYGESNGWSGGSGPGWGYEGTGDDRTIHVGTLDLDIYDAAAKQLIWRGSVSKTLDPNAKPEKAQKNLEKAMKKLLRDYPSPKKD